jgi:tRNA(Ile)-lysidine synthase
VTAHHVDHGLRSSSSDEAAIAVNIAHSLDIHCVVHRVEVDASHNLEAHARAARHAVLPPDALTGHTLDDQAETLLIRLLRGAGSDGLSAITPVPQHPILGLHRHDTVALCDDVGIAPVIDPSNDDPSMWRNRIRHEVLPLLNDIAERDLVPILSRTADVLRHDAEFLNGLAAEIDPTDANALCDADPVLATRALRQWLTRDGYPPNAAAIQRVLGVARGDAIACEIDGGIRIARKHRRLRIITPDTSGE